MWEDADDVWDECPEDDGGCAELTAAERLLYALGQLYARHHRGELDVAPADFDVRLVAQVVGVARDIELASDGPLGRSFHFAGEVLVLDRDAPFPWRIIDIEEWALWTDALELDLGELP